MTPLLLSFEAIGTHWTIEIFSASDNTSSEELQQNVLGRIDEFDRIYSRFRADSLVTRMSQKAGSYELPKDAKPLMDLYRELYGISGGYVTPLIGQTMEQAGYDAEYSLKSSELTTPPSWDDTLDYNFPKLSLSRPALLDFGAAGKGYLVDIIAEVLGSHGLHEFCINAGGDIVCQIPEGKTVDVALEHPGDPNMAIGVAHIGSQSLCGSSGNRRKWGEFHHIISPSTLKSPQHIAAVWVVANTGLLADGLTTALFFMNPEKLKEYFDFEYAIVKSDFSLDHSPNFPADFFTS